MLSQERKTARAARWGRAQRAADLGDVSRKCVSDFPPLLLPRPHRRDMVTRPCEQHWDELTERQKQRAAFLGFDAATWVADDWTAIQTPWSELSNKQHNAARALGFTASRWSVAEPAPGEKRPRTDSGAQSAAQESTSRPKPNSKQEGWVGQPTSVGANHERFYESCFVGEEGSREKVHVGDTVRLKSPDGSSDCFIARVEALWEGVDGQRWMEGRWYYFPEETRSGRLPGHDPRELFESVHTDENNLETIDGICVVFRWDEYQRWLDEPDAGDDDDDDVYACRAQYHPGTGEVRRSAPNLPPPSTPPPPHPPTPAPRPSSPRPAPPHPAPPLLTPPTAAPVAVPPAGGDVHTRRGGRAPRLVGARALARVRPPFGRRQGCRLLHRPAGVPPPLPPGPLRRGGQPPDAERGARADALPREGEERGGGLDPRRRARARPRRLPLPLRHARHRQDGHGPPGAARAR